MTRFLLLCLFSLFVVYVTASDQPIEAIEENEGLQYYYYFLIVMDIDVMEYYSICDRAIEPVQMVFIYIFQIFDDAVSAYYYQDAPYKMEEAHDLPLHREPDFSGVTDAEQCKEYPVRNTIKKKKAKN